MTADRSRPYVAVCGADPCSAAEHETAEEVGRLLARAHAVVVCGGGGGVMEAVARGAASEGGTVVGLLPTSDRSYANDYVTVAIPTGIGEMRNVLVVRAADAVVAIGGEFGTLSEIAFALKTGVPVVGVETWQLSKGGREVGAFPTTANAVDAVQAALRLATRHT